jgi:hypothetical protein
VTLVCPPVFAVGEDAAIATAAIARRAASAAAGSSIWSFSFIPAS